MVCILALFKPKSWSHFNDLASACNNKCAILLPLKFQHPLVGEFYAGNYFLLALKLFVLIRIGIISDC